MRIQTQMWITALLSMCNFVESVRTDGIVVIKNNKSYLLSHKDYINNNTKLQDMAQDLHKRYEEL